MNRDVLNWKDANSEEFSKTTTHPVVVSMLEHNVEQKGGTMRLGERVSVFKDMPEGQTSMMRVMYGNHKGKSRRKRKKKKKKRLFRFDFPHSIPFVD